MKSIILASVLTLSIAATGAAHAQQYVDASTLRAAATGVRFQSGRDMYRMLPGTVVTESVPQKATPSAPQSAAHATLARSGATTSPNDRVAARIGPYTVVLNTPAGDALGVGSHAERPIAAAVNERNGRIVLVNPQVKLTGTTPASATSLAASSGGAIAYTSTVDSSAVITYSSVERAQRALAYFQHNGGGCCVKQAALVVMQAVVEPM